MRALAGGQSPLRVAWGGVRLREACGRWRSGSRRPAPVARHRPGRQPPGRCFTRRSQGSDTFLSLLRKACHFPEMRDVDEAPPGGARLRVACGRWRSGSRRPAWRAGAGGRAVAGPRGVRALEVGQSPALVACGRWRSGSRRRAWHAGAGGRAVAPARVACGWWAAVSLGPAPVAPPWPVPLDPGRR